MSLVSIRQYVENKMIPKYFYQSCNSFMETLLADKYYIFNIIDDIAFKENIENTLSKEQYEISVSMLANGIRLVILTMPDMLARGDAAGMIFMFDFNYDRQYMFSCEYISEEKSAVYGIWGEFGEYKKTKLIEGCSLATLFDIYTNKYGVDVYKQKRNKFIVTRWIEKIFNKTDINEKLPQIYENHNTEIIKDVYEPIWPDPGKASWH